jgi:hypothetical protein
MLCMLGKVPSDYTKKQIGASRYVQNTVSTSVQNGEHQGIVL